MKESFAGDWRAASALLDIALELPPEQREAWLESLSGDDVAYVATLRDFMARNALLEQSDFMARLPEFSAGHSDLGEDEGPRPDERIGPYILIKLLGQRDEQGVFGEPRGRAHPNAKSR